MSAAATSKWARAFVLASAGFLLLWQVVELVGAPRRTAVVLGVYGFVLHMVFGKAYSLVPSYFDRELATARAMPVHLLCTATGTALLAADPYRAVPADAAAVGSVLWVAGIALFLGAILGTIRDNPTGRETGTGEANAHRRPTDRLANRFVPVALAYLAAGSYETLAAATALPGLFDGYLPRVSHLLAAGAAATLVFAIGFRLLPRFLVASPPRALVLVVLPAGAVGPALLAASLGGGWLFRLGAAVEAVAVLGFAAAYAVLLRRSDRDRVGFYGVLGGALSGSLAVLLGLSFAFDGVSAGLVVAHFRLNVLGFLGLTIVGVAYQFYPPSVGSFRGASDRTAFVSIVLIGGGLLVEVAGLVAGIGTVATLGRGVAFLGCAVYSLLVAGLFYDRYY